jgi:hypothetical protein
MDEPRVIVLTRVRRRYRAAAFADLADAAKLVNPVVMGAAQPTVKRALQSLAFTIGQHEERGEFDPAPSKNDSAAAAPEGE